MKMKMKVTFYRGILSFSLMKVTRFHIWNTFIIICSITRRRGQTQGNDLCLPGGHRLIYRYVCPYCLTVRRKRKKLRKRRRQPSFAKAQAMAARININRNWKWKAPSHRGAFLRAGMRRAAHPLRVNNQHRFLSFMRSLVRRRWDAEKVLGSPPMPVPEEPLRWFRDPLKR